MAIFDVLKQNEGEWKTVWKKDPMSQYTYGIQYNETQGVFMCDLGDDFYLTRKELDVLKSAVDKAIEWANIASKNNVKYIKKEIPNAKINATFTDRDENKTTTGDLTFEFYWDDKRGVISVNRIYCWLYVKQPSGKTLASLFWPSELNSLSSFLSNIEAGVNPDSLFT